MTRLAFAQIDAFADRPFAGNPAAVMPLDHWLDDGVLQQIAIENNLSETAFFVPDVTGQADYELRWFTPASEVRLCGHATLASGHFLLSRDGRAKVRFRTRLEGMLEVARDGDGYRMMLPAWRAVTKDMPDIVAALNLFEAPVEARWHGSRYGLVVVEDEDIVRTLRPDLAALATLGDVLTIVSAPGLEHDFVSRVFAPAAGVPEDPVTGSAHALLTPYWAERLGRNRLTAFQASARGGRVTCELLGDHVALGGACVTVIEGVFLLPE